MREHVQSMRDSPAHIWDDLRMYEAIFTTRKQKHNFGKVSVVQIVTDKTEKSMGCVCFYCRFIFVVERAVYLGIAMPHLAKLKKLEKKKFKTRKNK